jgi:hypothetical protein
MSPEIAPRQIPTTARAAPLAPHQLGDEGRQLVKMIVCKAVLDSDIPTLNKARFGQTPMERRDIIYSIAGGPAAEIANYGHRLLRRCGHYRICSQAGLHSLRNRLLEFDFPSAALSIAFYSDREGMCLRASSRNEIGYLNSIFQARHCRSHFTATGKVSRGARAALAAELVPTGGRELPKRLRRC